jgi:hypothetical protein
VIQPVVGIACAATAFAIGALVPTVDEQCAFFDTCDVDVSRVELRSAPAVDPSKLIVDVYGSRADGFTVAYADGKMVGYPPGADWRAECATYDRRVERVACNATRRTTMHWLTRMRDALS